MIDNNINAYVTTNAQGVVSVDQDIEMRVYAMAPAEILATSVYLQYDPAYLTITENSILLSSDFSIVIEQKSVTDGIISFSIASVLPVALSADEPIATITAHTVKMGTTGVRVLKNEKYETSLWGADYPSRNFLAEAIEGKLGILTISNPVIAGGGGSSGGGGGVRRVVTQPTGDDSCFADTEGHPYGEEIFCIVKRAGIFKGYPDGTFGATNNINRAEMATVLARSLMSEDQISTRFTQATGMHSVAELIFPDIELEQWFAKYIYAARQLGLVEGHEDGTYKPSNDVNYVEAVKMIVSFAAEKNPEIKSLLQEELGFGESLWYMPYLRVAQTFELITGQPMALLRANPGGAAKREWVAFMIANIPGL